MKHSDLADADCAIAQALGVVGDWWTLLIVRDVAGGIALFDDLQRELSISRKTLTERLKLLVAHGVLERRAYSRHPPRYEYHLTDTGRGLLPVLIALQDWGTRHVAGDGSLTATSTPTSAEARRVHGLVGKRLPEIPLPSHTGTTLDPAGAGWTVLYAFPGAFAPEGNPFPPGWSDIPGAAGCTLESTTYRDRYPAFAALNVTVHGLSTQRPDQLRAFADHAALPFPLLSDEDLNLAAALRLPTFRAAGVDRLKRLTLIIDPARTIRAVQFPITDPAGSVDESLTRPAELSP
ncbi:MAG: redoxin domain-containing protein [Actinophytocola sp.]|uniref:winged helix-turn-helix transcriptional regulator n=1 Tax=Actinophytocola sp. TaxID=1872138 RepID=UPI0013282EC2|nr:winged helix-turn-helix transcriptional regulator [Actinophytocola sp.]MPZ84057.1 redoxin domain-containing protein [Actinophytocola sp.]